MLKKQTIFTDLVQMEDNFLDVLTDREFSVPDSFQPVWWDRIINNGINSFPKYSFHITDAIVFKKRYDIQLRYG